MRPAVVAIIGAGPSGVSVLERIGANARQLLGDRPLEVHMVDPYPPGPGRHWRHDQSPLLVLNTTAANVTMFTDDSVLCQGPIRSGPSLASWAEQQARDGWAGTERAELAGLVGKSFPTRRLNSHYLRWVYEQALAGQPEGTRVHQHRDRAIDLVERGGRERVLLAGGASVEADAVVLAVGHQDVEPTAEYARLTEYAAERGLYYLPPGYGAEEDLSPLRPGDPVLVRGLGLAFVDLAVLLTEGRGGRYVDDGAGGLRYLPSGREPVLYAGSRRGLPYPPKRMDSLPAGPPLPRFFDPERILQDGPARLDFRADVWPSAAREIEWAYYHTLCATHPDRVRAGADEFATLFTTLFTTGDDTARRRLVQRLVHDPADVLDIARLDRPLGDMRFPDRRALHRRAIAHLRAALARAAAPRFDADLGLLLGVLSVFTRLPMLLDSGRFTARSWESDVDGWFAGLVNCLASGPPPRRVHELVALADAGVLRFVGPDMWVRAARGRFTAGSPALAETVTATALLEARLPVGSAPRSRDPLISALYRREELRERSAVDEDGYQYRTGFALVDQHDCAVLDTAGRRHPRRFALGPFTTAPAGGNFTRPGANPVSSRLTDAVSRAALCAAAGSGR